MPPSAMASNTTLAWFNADCGLASGLFSIWIEITGFLLKLGSTWTPDNFEASVIGFGGSSTFFSTIVGLVASTGVGLLKNKA